MQDAIISKCPITGLKLTTHPNWTNIFCSPDFSISYTIIENNILLFQPKGSANLDGVKKSLDLAVSIIEENFDNKQFVCIEDFTNVVSPTIKSRKYYILFMKKLTNLKSIIFINRNPILKLSITLGQKFNFFSFDIYKAKDYSDAINIALKSFYSNKELEIINNKPIVTDKSNWDIQFDDYSVRHEIINKNILHIVSKGTFDIKHTDYVFEYLEKFIKDIFENSNGEYYYVVDVNNFSITRKCRKIYLKKIQSIYKRFPFRSYVYYGTNRLQDILAIFFKPFVNFKVKNANDFKDALDFVHKDKNKKNKEEKKQNISNETQGYIDEFIAFLGQIDWENDGFDKNYKKDASHPFYQVYDAITLIKTDLDELYLEKQKNEEEKTRLQYKLQQSLKLETMGKLAGSVAHDLNNVLSGIVSYPDIILKELPINIENEKAVKYIKRMQISGKKAADIVQDLLTLSRSGVVNFELVNINTVIEEYLKSPEFNTLKSLYPKISIEYNLSDSLDNISASSIHLSKTIMNLIINAAEAISDKGKIIISTKNKYFNNIQIKGYDKKAEGDFIELIVSDNGLGISEQDQPKIFEPFYSKKTMGKSGTGLGMMVIKGTVEDHNGFIILKSKENKGTEFKLYFPVKKDIIKKNFVKKVTDFTGKGESILIIDDDEDQRIISYKIIKNLQYSVTTVSSGESAIKYLKNNTADLLILDMIMHSGMGGLETYKLIKEINPNQKAIIVSGYATTEDVKEVQRLGAGKYIKKPYTIEDIGIAIFEELN